MQKPVINSSMRIYCMVSTDLKLDMWCSYVLLFRCVWAKFCDRNLLATQTSIMILVRPMEWRNSTNRCRNKTQIRFNKVIMTFEWPIKYCLYVYAYYIIFATENASAFFAFIFHALHLHTIRNTHYVFTFAS